MSRKLSSMVPPELLERHEFAPFKSDTFDGATIVGHLNALALYMGPQCAHKEMNFAHHAKEDRHDREQDVVTLIDRISRKHALFTGSDNKVFFLKGHFLNAAEALERRWPEATFLTMVRDPVKRIQSGINYLRVNPSDPSMGPIPWGWLTPYLVAAETDYCKKEQQWFSTQSVGNRCVVDFKDFVSDLPGTMQYVYKTCFDESDLPEHVPRAHPPRERSNYSVDRSLHELGVDEQALKKQLRFYYDWLDRLSGLTA